MEEPWTILELAELAAETLAASRPAGTPVDAGTPSESARANGRVRDVPNERLVRWYVTVGLVDPPLSRRGRVAQYGRRHLLQLVAVKRRQAEGRSLAEIQAELAGATNEALAAVARVPDTRPAADAPAAEALAAAPARFWARQPGQPAPAPERPIQLGPAAAEGIGYPGAGTARQQGPPAPATAGRPGSPVPAAEGIGHPGPATVDGGLADRTANPPGGLVHGIRLAPGITLLLEGAGREPGPDDVTGIVNAAQPLLVELASRRLRASGPGHPPDVPDQSPGVGQLTEGARHDH